MKRKVGVCDKFENRKKIERIFFPVTASIAVN